MQAKSKLAPNHKNQFAYFAGIILTLGLLGEVLDVKGSRAVLLVVLLICIDTVRRENLNQLKTQFRNAAKDNNVARLRELLPILTKNNIDATCPKTKQNALHFAVNGNAIEAIIFLLENEARFPTFSRSNSFGNISFLASKSLLVNQQDIAGNTPLHEALKQIIYKSTDNLDTLVALLVKTNTSTLVSNIKSLLVWPSPSLNTKIDTVLVDHEGNTYQSLIDKIGICIDPEYSTFIEQLLYLIKTDREILKSYFVPPSLSDPYLTH